MPDDYAAATELERRLRAVFTPPDSSDTVEWLENNVREIPYSPIKGPFRISSAPWLAEPLYAFADPEVRQVLTMAAVQTGKSQMVELATAHIIARDPGPTLALQDKDENAKDWVKTRLKILWPKIPPVAALLPPEERYGDALIQFDAMPLWVLGARNIRNLQRRSVKYGLFDEIWQYPPGHLREAKARATAYKGMGKYLLASQGGYEGTDLHTEWLESTRREWGFHCPKCGHLQKWSRDSLEFRGAQRTDGEWDFQKLLTETHIKCENPSCSECIPDSNASRFVMNETGKYIKTATDHRPFHEGYRWNKMAGHPWAGIAEDIIRARMAAESGDDKPRRQVAQKVFAEFWSDQPDDEVHVASSGGYIMMDLWVDEAVLLDNGKIVPSNAIPDGSRAAAPLRVITVDVQRTSFWVVCRSWSADGKSRLRGYANLRTWEDVDRFVAEHGVAAGFVWADCGDADDTFWTEMKRRGWRALRGDKREEYAWRVKRDGQVVTAIRPYSPAMRFGNSYQYAVPVHYFSNLVMKDRLNSQRRRGLNTVADDADPEYHKQMESEFRRKDPKTGRYVWTQRGNRPNHLWDCETMQYVVIFSLGIFKYESRVPTKPQTDTEESPEEAEPVEAAA